MQGNAQGLVAFGQLNTPGFGGDKLPRLLGNHGLTRVQVDGGLGLSIAGSIVFSKRAGSIVTFTWKFFFSPG